ncbi:MAG: anthranilate synthase component I family protein [Nitrospirae bacterium]|nr:anthranilate synthase component I family protein [Nitrospirota bacterium]
MIINEAAFRDSPTPLPLIGTLPARALAPPDLYPLFRTSRPSFLLESSPPPGGGTTTQGRYSFLGGDPYRIVTARGNHVETWETGMISAWTGDPFDYLRTVWARSAVTRVPGFPPFLGGAVGCLGYGCSRRRRRAGTELRCSEFPDVCWLFVDLVVAFDHMEHTLVLAFCPPGERFRAESRTRLLAEGRERLDALAASIETRFAALGQGVPASFPSMIASPSMSQADYCEMVERAKAYIAAGDIFQANLAQRFTAAWGEHDAFELYRRLRTINPAPFAAYIDLGDTQVVGSSPERLVRLSGREADTRPIAGTRPRGRTAVEDTSLTTELLLNAKERAEHVMLVDLERNDLGRVCNYGSVKVDEFMVTERYSHVIHIVSNVRGRLRDGATGFDLLDAVFPGGTVTGVPKIRCLDIIEELEPTPRGLYTGSIGYLSWSGEMDWNIVIRTIEVHRNTISMHAGAGIVADSEPEREYSETLYKAQALFDALG